MVEGSVSPEPIPRNILEVLGVINNLGTTPPNTRDTKEGNLGNQETEEVLARELLERRLRRLGPPNQHS